MERACLTGEWVLRVYSWLSPTISLGRSQVAKGQYDLTAIESRHIGVVRRLTGGRAILHDREITYSVTAPAHTAGSLAESYDRINALLMTGLEAIGVRASVSSGLGRAPRPGISPCFDEPVAGELTVDGRKLAGSAQFRNGGAMLQHGSILVDDDQCLLSELTRGGRTPRVAPATLSETLGRAPEYSEVADALAHAVRKLEDPQAAALVADEALRARASVLVVRYLDDDWTWRR